MIVGDLRVYLESRAHPVNEPFSICCVPRSVGRRDLMGIPAADVVCCHLVTLYGHLVVVKALRNALERLWPQALSRACRLLVYHMGPQCSTCAGRLSERSRSIAYLLVSTTRRAS